FAQIENYILIPDVPYPPSKDELVLTPESETIFKVFDPNSVNKEDLLSLGFNQFQASNLIKYRESGGKFTQLVDLLKIYGVDSGLVRSLENYIEIAEVPIEFSPETPEPDLIWVELNSADSVDLVQLKGIGPVYA